MPCNTAGPQKPEQRVSGRCSSSARISLESPDNKQPQWQTATQSNSDLADSHFAPSPQLGHSGSPQGGTGRGAVLASAPGAQQLNHPTEEGLRRPQPTIPAPVYSCSLKLQAIYWVAHGFILKFCIPTAPAQGSQGGSPQQQQELRARSGFRF